MYPKFTPVFLFFLSIFFPEHGFTQGKDTVATYSSSAYVDGYYAWYSDSVGIGNYQKFPTVSPRSNSFGLNILQILSQFQSERVRALAALHFGDIPRSTWSPNYNIIEEAHAGVRLAKTLWLDGGFFRTHFGTEYLLPKENLTSSVSIGTYYEPYYEAGFRLNSHPSEKLEVSLYVLNGYGLYEDNNSKKSFGFAFNYAVNDKVGLGWTAYRGDDAPQGDTISRDRLDNNLYLNYASGKVKFQVGGDYCLQHHADLKTAKNTASMYSALATAKYQFKPSWAAYARGEIFQDPDGFMAGVIKGKDSALTGLKIVGITAGLEYRPAENSYMRLEARGLAADQDQPIFRTNGKNVTTRMEVMLHMGVTFDLANGAITK